MEYYLNVSKAGISAACEGPDPQAPVAIIIHSPCTPNEASDMLAEAAKYLKTYDVELASVTGTINKIAIKYGYNFVSLPEVASIMKKRKV